MGAVGVDGEAHLHPRHVRHRNRPTAQYLVNRHHPGLEVIRVVSIGRPTGRLDGRNLVILPGLLGELLDSTLADLELLGHEVGVHPMINYWLTYPGDRGLLELHFVLSITEEIMWTKSFQDSTVYEFRTTTHKHRV